MLRLENDNEITWDQTDYDDDAKNLHKNNEKNVTWGKK